MVVPNPPVRKSSLTHKRGSIFEKNSTRVFGIVEETGPDIVKRKTSGTYSNGSFLSFFSKKSKKKIKNIKKKSKKNQKIKKSKNQKIKKSKNQKIKKSKIQKFKN